MNDPVTRPDYYGGPDDPFEPVKVIEAWGLGFHAGNAVKYLRRAGRKPGAAELDDLRKCLWYVRRLVEMAERDAGCDPAPNPEPPPQPAPAPEVSPARAKGEGCEPRYRVGDHVTCYLSPGYTFSVTKRDYCPDARGWFYRLQSGPNYVVSSVAESALSPA